MSRMLLVKDVAAMMRVHQSTIYRYVQDGKIPYVRLPGGDVRFRENDLNKWIEGQHRKAR